MFRRWRWGGVRALEGRWGQLEAWGCPTLPRVPCSPAPRTPAPASPSPLPPIHCLGVAKANTSLPAGSRIWWNVRAPASPPGSIPGAVGPERVLRWRIPWADGPLVIFQEASTQFGSRDHPWSLWVLWHCRTPPCWDMGEKWGAAGSFSPTSVEPLGCLPHRAVPPGLLWAPYAFSSAGSKRGKRQEKYSAGRFFFLMQTFFFFG